MTSQRLATLTFAVCALLVGQPAIAGDSNNEYYNEGSDADVYDERSNDRYGERITRKDSYKDEYLDQDPYEHREKRDRKDSKRYGSYKDHESYKDHGSYKDEALPPVYPRARRHHHRRFKYRRHADVGCLPRRLIRRHLRSQGWRRIRVMAARGPVIRVKARNRHERQRYMLALDRCTGEVIAARPLPRFFHRRRFSRHFH